MIEASSSETSGNETGLNETGGRSTPTRPAPGERARTLAYGLADGVLAVPGVPYAQVPAHATDADGRPLLLMPAESAVVSALAGKPNLPATLRISDVAPVALPDRVRGRAWLHGWISEIPEGERREAAVRISRLHPRSELLEAGAAGDARRRWTVLALDIAEIEIRDMWGEAAPEPEEYAAAAPDPLVAIESGILSHLDDSHRGELVTMLRLLNGASPTPVVQNLGGPDPGGPGPVVRPLALDRYGMWLRCSGGEPKPGHTGPDPTPNTGSTTGHPVDVRIVFGEPVSDIHGLRGVYRRLFAGVSS